MREERREESCLPACLLSTEKEARLRVPPSGLTHRSQSRCPSWRWRRSPWPDRGEQERSGLRRPSKGKGGNPELRVERRLAWLGLARTGPFPPLPSAPHLAFPATAFLFLLFAPLRVFGSGGGGGLTGGLRSEREAAARALGWFVRFAAVPPSLPPQLTHDGNDGLPSAASFFGVGVLTSVPDARK